MVAPMVTGVVALISGKYPTLLPAQIKSAILCGVDTYAAFNGYCVTGGRLNAYKSLQLAGNCYTIDTSKNWIKKIEPGTAVVDFKPQMRATSTAYNTEVVVRKGGSSGAIKTSGAIATGDDVQVKNGAANAGTYTVRIRGDASADGYIDIDDTLVVREVMFGTTTLTGVRKEAADANRDGRIDIDDTLIIRDHMFGYVLINQN